MRQGQVAPELLFLASSWGPGWSGGQRWRPFPPASLPGDTLQTSLHLCARGCQCPPAGEDTAGMSFLTVGLSFPIPELGPWPLLCLLCNTNGGADEIQARHDPQARVGDPAATAGP